MDAIHVNKTRCRDECRVEDFELLTTALSALKWREHNGRITMYTDSAGYEFYKRRGLLDLWDGGVSRELDDMPDVNENMFWAGGKIFALSKCSAPVVMIDTDFIVWAPLAFNNLPELTVIHSEDLYTDVYPDIGHFKMKYGYIFDPDWDWSLRALNTAFAVFKSDELIHTYTDAAMRFMRCAENTDDNLTYMVFAEQRILPMCAKKLGATVKELSTLERLFCDGERYFTHVWGMKRQMRENDALRYDFCMRCANRLKRDFPSFSDVLAAVPEVERYFR